MWENTLPFLVMSYHAQYNFSGSIHLLANFKFLLFFAPEYYSIMYMFHIFLSYL